MKTFVEDAIPAQRANGPDADASELRSANACARSGGWRRVWCRAAAVLAGLAIASPAAAGRLATLDDLFYRVASDTNGFAGAWYADDGALTVAVRPAGRTVTSAEKKRALNALVSVFGKDVLEPVPAMKRSQPGIGKVAFQRADYRFLDLHAWYRDVRPVLELRGVGYTDINERTNRLVVGVAGGKPSADVVNYLSKIGAPFSAIVFEDSQELYYYYSGSIIGSEQRPALGGIELGLQQGGRCTLGINAFFPVWWWEQPGFITAGHCGSFGDWSADWFSQPEDGEIIAAEHLNPGFVGGDDCPTDGCRHSDAAAVLYDGDVEFADPPGIIRTMDFEGDVNVDTSNQTIDVTGESPWHLSGDNVYKVGVGIGGGGGWTVGSIGTTCAEFLAPGSTTETFLCQYDVSSADGTPIACVGDSGAPVFFWHETIMPNAAMAGILFAGTATPCSSTYVFSPMFGVRDDLGQFEIPY